MAGGATNAGEIHAVPPGLSLPTYQCLNFPRRLAPASAVQAR